MFEIYMSLVLVTFVSIEDMGPSIKPGFVWQNWNYALKVVKVEGDVVTFQSLNHPDATFMGYKGLGCNKTTKQYVWKVLRECKQPEEFLNANKTIK